MIILFWSMLPIKGGRPFLKNEGFSDDNTELRIKGQHIKINKEKVTFIINNDGSKINLLEKVERVLKDI